MVINTLPQSTFIDQLQNSRTTHGSTIGLDKNLFFFAGNNFQTPTSYEDLDQQFEENLTEIKGRYTKFVAELCKSITSKGVTVDEFRNFLLSISAFEDENDEQHCNLLSEVRDKLEKAESINKIFSFVSDWGSFLMT